LGILEKAFSTDEYIKEVKDRVWDRKYVRKHFPRAGFIEFKNMGHGSMASLYPQKWLSN
jgi:hypothetical protein